MKKELNYLASKRLEKVGRQELRSTPCKQEIDPWTLLNKEVSERMWDLFLDLLLITNARVLSLAQKPHHFQKCIKFLGIKDLEIYNSQNLYFAFFS
jgi:hypothetical protein